MGTIASSSSKVAHPSSEASKFSVQFGYHDNQITSDRRFRIEQALRNAGLQNTEYGRFIIANAQSSKPGYSLSSFAYVYS